MRNLKFLSMIFIMSALFLTLNSVSFAASDETAGQNLTGNAVSGKISDIDSSSAGRISEGAENSSIEKENSSKKHHNKNKKGSGKRSIFGKVFNFFEGLFDKTVGFFKKIGSALGFKGCENSDKTARANDNNDAANGETAASNNTETVSNESSSANTNTTAASENTPDTSIAAVSENLTGGKTTNAENTVSSTTGDASTDTVSNSSVNGGNTAISTAQTSAASNSSVNGGNTVSTKTGAAQPTSVASSSSNETLTPQTSNNTPVSTSSNTADNDQAVSNTENNTQTSTAANTAETNTAAAETSTNTGVTGTIPERAAGAEGGKAFMARVNSMSLTNYDKAVLDEITRGNIPDFLKNFKEVKVNFKTKDGKEHTASYFAMPDYLAIGSNDDFVRVPMTPMAAQKIAEMYGCQLPTKKMVDDIYSQATVKLNPQPISVDKGISKISNFAEHQKMVEKQRAGQPLGALTAGDKKDVVITNLLDQAAAAGKKQVAIYGWHQKNGKPIQPLSTIHNYYHVDYSHGIRLIKDTMIVDGKTVKVADVLKDAELSKAVSYEGTIKNTKAHR